MNEDYYYKYCEDKLKFIMKGEESEQTYNEVVLVFDIDHIFEDSGKVILLKHGTKELVEEYYNTLILKIKEHKIEKSFNLKLLTIEEKHFKTYPDLLDDLNRCLSTTGYINKFLKKYNFFYESSL